MTIQRSKVPYHPMKNLLRNFNDDVCGHDSLFSPIVGPNSGVRAELSGCPRTHASTRNTGYGFVRLGVCQKILQEDSGPYEAPFEREWIVLPAIVEIGLKRIVRVAGCLHG